MTPLNRYVCVCVFSLTIFAVLQISCQPPTVEMARKIRLAIPPLTDATGTYGSEPRFDSLCIKVLMQPTIELCEQLNYRDEWQLSEYENPFEITAWSGSADYVLKGDVEVLSYSRPDETDSNIASFALLGLPGMMLFGGSSDMAGAVQYRFLLEPKTGKPKPLLIAGVSEGDPSAKSRRKLMAEANSVAAMSLAQRLFELIEKEIHFTRHPTAVTAWDPNVWKAKYSE